MVKPKWFFGLFQKDFIYRHHVEPRIKLYVLVEESFPIPLRYIDVTRATATTLDVMSEKHIEDYWNFDGDRELSDAWTGFTRFIVLTEKPPDGHTWSGERLTRNQTTSRPDNVWPDMWKHMSDASKTQREAKVGNRETKARKCEKFAWYSLYWSWLWRIQAKSEKCSRKNWKFRCQPQCLVDFINIRSTGTPAAILENTRQNTLVSSELTNLWESEWKELLADIMNITLQEKAWIHWVTKV